MAVALAFEVFCAAADAEAVMLAAASATLLLVATDVASDVFDAFAVATEPYSATAFEMPVFGQYLGNAHQREFLHRKEALHALPLHQRPANAVKTDIGHLLTKTLHQSGPQLVTRRFARNDKNTHRSEILGNDRNTRILRRLHLHLGRFIERQGISCHLRLRRGQAQKVPHPLASVLGLKVPQGTILT